MRNSLTLIGAVALITCVSTAHAFRPGSYLLQLDEEMALYGDATSIVQRGGYVRGWYGRDYRVPNEDGALRVSFLAEVDCGERRMRSLTQISRDESNSVLNRIDDPSRWTYIQPGTHAEGISNFACNTAKGIPPESAAEISVSYESAKELVREHYEIGLWWLDEMYQR